MCILIYFFFLLWILKLELCIKEYCAPKSLQTVTAAMKLKDACSWKESCDKTRQYIKNQRYHFADKGLYNQRFGFPSSNVWMWELDHKKDEAPKNWCFWIVVLEKILESPLDCKEIKPVSPKGSQPWIFTGRTNAEALVLWPPNVKSLLVGIDLDARKYWRQKEKRVAEDEMVR